ncbi:TAL effector repeat-containing protein [Ralstonia pseudosolanacearum]|nr:TAL effector repeat-containing protein [Ralstonia pseudosolanacearum]UYR05082.1 TAL effector repeat-containing protein [Ralstonia pseudosolanacearum]UYR05709.1 TAL effector repeat-containing protein [Ralstonia pseudosolanacearum]UYR14917.1 TAL effector repeat-containing protein [Ralstonia pseudosolanacearum]
MPVSLPVVSSPRFSAGSSAAITDPFSSLPPTPVLYAMARELKALSDATWQPAVPLPAEPPTDARRGNTVFDEASASSPVIASACPQAFASPPRAPRSARARRARTGGDAWPAPTFLSRPSSSRIGRDVFGKLVALGYSREQIRKLKQESLSEIAKYHTTLTGQGFTHADICRISRRRQSLRVVARNYPELAAALPELTRAHIVDIARQRSGDLALQALLPVATALTAAPLRLSASQIATVAQYGERPAIQALYRLRRKLTRAPLHLTPQQVVAIASHDGGKPALEAVWAKLPVLRGVPYALSTAQVVAIACISGQQALEAIEAHMPTLRQAPHSLSPERVAAIACIGGRSAVEAVRQGLPVKAIRRIRREKAPVAGPPPASLGPTPQELVAVLHFFRAHQQPRQAFVDALAAFQTTRPALLRLLSSVGVTEIEALGGTIPDATERWQRLLGRLGFRPATGAAAPSPDSLQGFAQSLERTLGSPGMAGQSACSPHRKRPAETAIAPRSIRRRPNNAGQPSEPWPDQLAWLQRRKRTARSHIRADSAASVPANLHLGTRAQFTPDRLRAEPGPIMQAHTSPASVSFGSHVAFEPGLPDPGTPTSADLASFEAEPFGVGPLDFHLDWLLQILEA